VDYLPEPGRISVKGTISLFEILSVVGFIVIVVSVILAVMSSIEQARTRRAEFSFRIWEAFMAEDIQQAYLDIEWGRFKYPVDTETGFSSPEEERRIDRLLYLFDEMALLLDTKVLKKSDQERWAYQGQRVFGNQSIQNYMKFLDDFFAKNGRNHRAHDLARRKFGN
jgi:hypothetical protein